MLFAGVRARSHVRECLRACAREFLLIILIFYIVIILIFHLMDRLLTRQSLEIYFLDGFQGT